MPNARWCGSSCPKRRLWPSNNGESPKQHDSHTVLISILRQGLIAINYPARAFGIGRHCDVTEAKKLCPDLIAQHVATWREGDDQWAYRSDAAANIATDKVSLDPYRLQSRRILALIKDTLPQNLQRVEKASIDEVFLDLSAHVHAVLLERFPELSNPPPYDDLTEKLPNPPVAALDWQADALIDLDEDQESQDPDWDDVAVLIGSEIVRDLRAKIHDGLGYTCSAGIANNKMISKLGSGFKKPNSQTVVRSRAVQTFLAGFKVTKIRNLGGKLGDQVVSAFHAESVKELLDVSLDRMKTSLGDETASWLYNTIRGIDTSEVNSRTQIKSMLSAKSFRPSINTQEQAVKWLRIFAGDIFSRLVEEGVLDNKRRPRSINLHHRHAGQTRSRQGPIPAAKVIDEEFLFQAAKGLLGQIVAEGKVWPCANLSLSVGGFEEGVKGNMGISAFLVKDEGVTAVRHSSPDTRAAEAEGPQWNKRSRVANGGIQRFFNKDSTDTRRDEGAQGSKPDASTASAVPSRDSLTSGAQKMLSLQGEQPQPSNADLVCTRCKNVLDNPEHLQNHQDWHLAKDLAEEEHTKHRFSQSAGAARSANPKSTGTTSKRSREGKLEQGQRKLDFG